MLQGFHSFEEVGASLSDLFFLSKRSDGMQFETVKFMKLVETSVSLPTELGLPVLFTNSMPLMASIRGKLNVAQGSVKIDMTTSVLSFKWRTEAQIKTPSKSGSYAATGLDVAAEIRGPKQVSFSISNGSLSWLPHPDEQSDSAYFHARPFSYETLDLGQKENSTEPEQWQPGDSIAFEMINGSDSSDDAAIWLQRFMAGSFSSLSPSSFRLRYEPSELSASLGYRWAQGQGQQQQQHQEEPTVVDFISGTNGTLPPPPLDDDVVNFTSPRPGGHLFEAHHNNGSTSSEWLSATAEIPFFEEVQVSAHNFSSDGNDDDSLRLDWLPAGSRRLISASIRSILHQEGEEEEEGEAIECHVQSDRVKTFDQVEYSYYTLNNSCHHVLTTDCASAKRNAFAVTLWSSGGGSDKFSFSLRVTLDKDVIDIGQSGSISVNGNDSYRRANRIQIRESTNHKLIASISRLADNETIRLELPNSDDDADVLQVLLDESSVKLTIPNGRFQGRRRRLPCGLCGDGDGEAMGEFKNSAGCALSTGALMAASFQVIEANKFYMYSSLII